MEFGSPFDVNEFHHLAGVLCHFVAIILFLTGPQFLIIAQMVPTFWALRQVNSSTTQSGGSRCDPIYPAASFLGVGQTCHFSEGLAF